MTPAILFIIICAGGFAASASASRSPSPSPHSVSAKPAGPRCGGKTRPGSSSVVHPGPGRLGQLLLTIKRAVLCKSESTVSPSKISSPYQSGHTLTAGEARALNSYRADNIRNNCFRYVAAGIASDLPATPEGMQKLADYVSEKDANYSFAMTNDRGGVIGLSPLEAEAWEIATGQALDRYGASASDEQIEDIASQPEVMKRAKRQLAIRATVAEASARGFAVMTSGSLDIGSRWTHRNGNEYQIICIANEPNEERYPLTVVYQGLNGKIWARRADDWHRSMTRLPK